jgi:hypothetical protein
MEDLIELANLNRGPNCSVLGLTNSPVRLTSPGRNAALQRMPRHQTFLLPLLLSSVLICSYANCTAGFPRNLERHGSERSESQD